MIESPGQLLIPPQDRREWRTYLPTLQEQKTVTNMLNFNSCCPKDSGINSESFLDYSAYTISLFSKCHDDASLALSGLLQCQEKESYLNNCLPKTHVEGNLCILWGFTAQAVCIQTLAVPLPHGSLLLNPSVPATSLLSGEMTVPPSRAVKRLRQVSTGKALGSGLGPGYIPN